MPSQYSIRDQRIIPIANRAFGVELYYMGGRGKLWDAETPNQNIRVQSKTCQRKNGSIVIHERDLTVEVDWLFSRWEQIVGEKGFEEDPVSAFYICFDDTDRLYEDASRTIEANIRAGKKNPGAPYTWNKILGLFDRKDRLHIIGE